MRFSRVSSVLSSVFSPALSCSLTSEHKQEATRRPDTSLQPSHAGSQSPNRRAPIPTEGSHTGSLCPRVSQHDDIVGSGAL